VVEQVLSDCSRHSHDAHRASIATGERQLGDEEVNGSNDERTPGSKLALAAGMAAILSILLFSIYLLNYDRRSESRQATESIVSGWGAAQTIGGPVLVIPYRATIVGSAVVGGQPVTRSAEVTRMLTLAPETIELSAELKPQLRRRSIYRAVVYQALVTGRARFALPPDLARSGIDEARIDLARAELRFAVSDPRGLGANPRVGVDGTSVRLKPGGPRGAGGFFAWTDATALAGGSLAVDFAFELRGNEALSLVPLSGETRWSVRSSWPSPSFGGDFLPGARRVGEHGFTAEYRIGNLALGRSLLTTGGDSAEQIAGTGAADPSPPKARIALVQPVDIYSRIDRATKYGFLFIGFTFLTLLMFDLIAGARVSGVEYLLLGAALVLFFVLLLAFAEVIGFAAAYLVASAAIAGLDTAYSAAVLGTWQRAGFIGGLLVALYGVLYVLISLEAFSLLIGSLLLFGALAGIMYATRRIDWSAPVASAQV
jgi:inner membrane protein